MRVRATQVGFFGGVLRQPGTPTEEFETSSPEEFSSEWMESLEPAPAPAPAQVKAPAPAPATATATADKL
jgi:hypothetical protein